MSLGGSLSAPACPLFDPPASNVVDKVPSFCLRRYYAALVARFTAGIHYARSFPCARSNPHTTNMLRRSDFDASSY